MRGGLTRRMVVTSGLLALVVGVAFAVLLVSIADLRTQERATTRAQQVLVSANQLERLVVDMETGVRGFVITGQERFLQPWRAAQAALPAVSRGLEELVNGGVQERRARQVTAAATSYLRDYSVPLIDSARRDPPAARTVALTLEGKRRVDAIRAELDQLIATERRLSAARQQRSDRAARRAVGAAAAGLAGSVLLVVVFATYLQRAIVRPVLAASAMAGRLAGGDLGARMPEAGVGEIGALQRSFNTMAASLEHSRAELAASRARIVAAADQARRRIERDLHDGVQQRLVSLGLDIRAVQADVPAELAGLRGELDQVAGGLGSAVDELRDLSRGIHPAILSEGGLGPALKALARRSAVPVRLQAPLPGRLPEPVEVAAYYVVSEALANAAKHAKASAVQVEADSADGRLHLRVRDDGVGGAEVGRGSGLIGLATASRRWAGRSSSQAPPARAPRCRSTSPSTPTATDNHIDLSEGDSAPMRIRTHTFVTLDGYVSTPDGRPIQLLLPGFPGATAYGLPEFLAGCEAVLMGRTTFLPALEAPDWPWTQPVFVLTSRPLPEGTPDNVTTAPTPAALMEAMQAAGVTGDIHLVGGPRTMQAFREIGALAEVGLLVVPRIQGGGVPLAPPGTEPMSLTLRSTRTFPDGVIEAWYRP